MKMGNFSEVAEERLRIEPQLGKKNKQTCKQRIIICKKLYIYFLNIYFALHEF